MPFAGETVRIVSRIKDYDGVAITNASGVTVSLDLYDANRAHIAGPYPMAWNATDGYWYFDWDTSALAAGSYRSKVTVEGGTPTLDAWQVGRVRLTASPV